LSNDLQRVRDTRTPVAGGAFLGAAWKGLKKAFGHRMFVACAILLGMSAASLKLTTEALGVRFRKQAVPLRRPLSDPSLKELMLPRYKFLQAISIPPESEEALGTKDYIMWRFRDTTIEKRNRPLSVVTVFVTYYTGAPDQVPHVPDVCYQGEGYVQKEAGTTEFSIPALGKLGEHVPLRTLTFERAETLRASNPTVSYLFFVNGRFKATRSDVRLALSNPFDREAYFSKIEIRFGRGGNDPPRDKAIKATGEVLSTLLPILVNRHYAARKAGEG